MLYVTSVGPDPAGKSSCGSYRKVTLYLCLCMITEPLCTTDQQPKFCRGMNSPLPLNDVLPGQCTSFPLHQACCFTLGCFIWCLPTSMPWKNCKSVPFTLSVLSVICTVSHRTFPSSKASPFNLSLYRSCSVSRNGVLLPLTRSFPFPPFHPRRDIEAAHVWCRRRVPGVQAAALHQLSPYAYSSSCGIFNCSWAH